MQETLGEEDTTNTQTLSRDLEVMARWRLVPFTKIRERLGRRGHSDPEMLFSMLSGPIAL